jgi:hypothetical protein
VKSRLRSEPPTPLSLDTDKNRRDCLSSGVAGGGKRMGRQRSRLTECALAECASGVGVGETA